MVAIVGMMLAAASSARAVEIDFDGANSNENIPVKEAISETFGGSIVPAPNIPARVYGNTEIVNPVFMSNKAARVYLPRKQRMFKEKLLAKAALIGDTKISDILAGPNVKILFDAENIYIAAAQDGGLVTLSTLNDPHLATDFASNITRDTRGKCSLVTKLVKSCTGGYIGAFCTAWTFVETIVEICEHLPVDPNPTNEPHGNCVMDGTC